MYNLFLGKITVIPPSSACTEWLFCFENLGRAGKDLENYRFLIWIKGEKMPLHGGLLSNPPAIVKHLPVWKLFCEDILTWSRCAYWAEYIRGAILWTFPSFREQCATFPVYTSHTPLRRLGMGRPGRLSPIPSSVSGPCLWFPTLLLIAPFLCSLHCLSCSSRPWRCFDGRSVVN